MSMSTTSSLRLWQLISPALPVGAYAYSQGLEYAIEIEWVTDEKSAHEWIAGQVNHSLAALDVPLLARLYKAWQKNDIARVMYWNHYLQASRESNELLNEDRHLGGALLRLLKEMDMRQINHWPAGETPSFATMFALAASHWMVTLKEACQGLLWTWSENQVAAAIKLVPLGQTAGQRILSGIIEDIPDAVNHGLSLADDDIGMASQGLAIASALHETQYSRLFRS